MRVERDDIGILTMVRRGRLLSGIAGPGASEVGALLEGNMLALAPIAVVPTSCHRSSMTDEAFIERAFDSGDDIVIARFFQPAQAPGGEFQCQWAINWPDRVQRRYACGVDGVQALMLAMKTVHTELMESDLYKSGKLTYADQYDLDLPPSWGDGQLYTPPDRSGS